MTRTELKQRIYTAIDKRAEEIIGLGELARLAWQRPVGRRSRFPGGRVAPRRRWYDGPLAFQGLTFARGG
jgi:hypothetical protein